jgi:hypothetical protein
MTRGPWAQVAPLPAAEKTRCTPEALGQGFVMFPESAMFAAAAGATAIASAPNGAARKVSPAQRRAEASAMGAG